MTMLKRSRIAIVLFLLLAAGISSCSKDTTPLAPINPDNSSWAALQEKVITPKCEGCHSAGTDFALQSGLVLTSNVAYNNLINISSHQVNAHADGLLRVQPKAADKSFLYIKVHGFDKDYGNVMPLGMKQLTVGQVEFIRQWIEAGAPREGVVADRKLLDDTTEIPEAAFVPLPPPAPGTGFQLHVGPFDVPTQFEREIFDYQHIGNGTDIYVNRIQTRMRTGSHHFILYTFDQSTPQSYMPSFDVIRDLHNTDGTDNAQVANLMGYHQFVGGSTIPNMDYHFPEGTALYVPANTALDLNSHYINYSDKVTQGEVYANIYTVPLSQVHHVANTILLSNTDIHLNAGEQKVITKDYLNTFNQKLSIFMLTSHMHARGVKYRILFKGLPGNPRNGEVLYESDDWDHPIIKNFDTPVSFQPGEGITSEATYNNSTDHEINYGLTSQDEMDIVIGYYYFN